MYLQACNKHVSICLSVNGAARDHSPLRARLSGSRNCFNAGKVFRVISCEYARRADQDIGLQFPLTGAQG